MDQIKKKIKAKSRAYARKISNHKGERIMEMPKGFRLTKRIKDILIPRLCFERFYQELDFMCRMERYLFFKIKDEVYPPKEQRKIERIFDRLPHRPKVVSISTIHMDVTFTRSKYHSYFGNPEYLGTNRALPERSQRMMYAWNYKSGGEESDAQIAWPYKFNERYNFLYPGDDYGSLQLRMDELSTPLRKEVAAHMQRKVDLFSRFEEYHELAQMTVNGVRSVKQLKEFSPKAYETLVIVANAIKPPCTDIPVADISAQLEKL